LHIVLVAPAVHAPDGCQRAVERFNAAKAQVEAAAQLSRTPLAAP
jgi:hypothetical protein